jgi:carnitine 3-dehydrogenase
MDTPELTDQLIDRLVAQSDAQAGGRSIRELEQIRDDNLIAILQALKTRRWGAGAVQAAHEARLFDAAHAAGAGAAPDLARPLRLHEAIVQPDWVDYNNHMTESRYLQVFGDASDAFLRLIGADAAYNASGFSYYTVETHLRHLREVAGLEPLACATQLLDADEKRLHLFHELRHGRDDRLLATGEHMLLHVDTRASAAVPAAAPVRAKLEEIRAAQAALPRPEAAGWRIAMTRER